MKKTKTLAAAFSAVLTCLLLLGGAMAQEALPQMVKVTFPEGCAVEAPKDVKDHYAADENGYGEDNLSYHDDSLDVQIHNIHGSGGFRGSSTSCAAAGPLRHRTSRGGTAWRRDCS